MSRRILLLAAVAAVAVIILVSSVLFTVRQAEQAIVLQFGAPVRVISEPGLKAKLPFVQNVEYFDQRILSLDPPVESLILADQKPLEVNAYARYRIIDPLKFYQTVRNEANLQDNLRPTLKGAVRDILGNVTLSQVLSVERTQIQDEMLRAVAAKAQIFGIELIDVRIRRADLPDQTRQAVFARMRTEREREAAEFRAQGFERAQQIRSSAEREATVIRAEAFRESEALRGQGDGEATKTYNRAYGVDPHFFDFFRSMAAYREAIRSDDTTFVLTPNSEFFRYFGDTEGHGKR
ncbi:MAG: protease modulator HflC [Alphaproteobacteria bacterium]